MTRICQISKTPTSKKTELIENPYNDLRKMALMLNAESLDREIEDPKQSICTLMEWEISNVTISQSIYDGGVSPENQPNRNYLFYMLPELLEKALIGKDLNELASALKAKKRNSEKANEVKEVNDESDNEHVYLLVYMSLILSHNHSGYGFFYRRNFDIKIHIK